MHAGASRGKIHLPHVTHPAVLPPKAAKIRMGANVIRSQIIKGKGGAGSSIVNVSQLINPVPLHGAPWAYPLTPPDGVYCKR